jgi:N-acylneuraminate cytidylyltransferase/CMP-N,N'-diacetyllegionaminic acid synthase
MSARILYLITARGGSKGVPRKNLADVGGLSLIGYKARAARQSSSCARLIISSDDAEIIEEAKRHGADAPFVRPEVLANDTASSDSVVLHAMNMVEAEEGGPYDAIMLLEPSSPFATAQDFDKAVNIFERYNASLVVGMKPTEVSSLFTGPLGENGRAEEIINKFSGQSVTRRQDMAPEYTMNGALYLIDWKMMRSTGQVYGDPDNTFGLVMDRSQSCEIETPLDLEFARFLVQQGVIDTTAWIEGVEG